MFNKFNKTLAPMLDSLYVDRPEDKKAQIRFSYFRKNVQGTQKNSLNEWQNFLANDLENINKFYIYNVHKYLS